MSNIDIADPVQDGEWMAWVARKLRTCYELVIYYLAEDLC